MYIPIKDIEDPDELIEAKKKNELVTFNNKLTANKKPYFFGYIYPNILTEMKKHKKAFKDIFVYKYNLSINEVFMTSKKTPEMREDIKNYYQHSPLLENKCTMNVLARYIEDIQFENKWKKNTDIFDHNILLDKDLLLDDELVRGQIVEVLKSCNKKQQAYERTFTYWEKQYVDEDYVLGKIDNNIFYDETELELLKLCPNKKLLCNYVIDIYYTELIKQTKSLIWVVFEEEIIANIRKNTKKIKYPIMSDEGENYLGLKFTMLECAVDDN